MTVPALSLLLFASILLNAYLLFYKKTLKQRAESVELQEFLADLLTGHALVHVARISPADVLLRSPRTLQ